MTALSTRDALAKAVRPAVHDTIDRCCTKPGSQCQYDEDEVRRVTVAVVDALIASGAVVDAATLVKPVVLAAIEAATTDPTGHLPNCGYTEEELTCGCLDWGRGLRAAVAAALTDRAS